MLAKQGDCRMRQSRSRRVLGVKKIFRMWRNTPGMVRSGRLALFFRLGYIIYMSKCLADVQPYAALKASWCTL